MTPAMTSTLQTLTFQVSGQDFFLCDTKLNGGNLTDKNVRLSFYKRPSASEALAHPYFQEEPQACEPKDLPISTLINQ